MKEQNLFLKLEDEKTFNNICDCLECENNIPGWPDRFGDSIKIWLERNNVAPIKTLSLFSGAGGLDIGFSDIGFDIVSSVEIEEKFCQTLEMNTGEGKRFQNSKVNCIDIRKFTGEKLGKIDFIIGGPPCQTFSAAGRRVNGVLGITDSRGVLFREYVRLLKELSPKGFLFENVYGIIGAQNGKPWQEIKEAFSSVGYQLFYRIIDAADYGVPQHRERLIIVGLKKGEFKFPRPTHGPDSIDEEPFYNAETAIEGVISKENDSDNVLGGRYGYLLNDIPPGLNYSFYTEEMGHPNPIFAWRSKFSDFLYKADPNTPVRTIKASGGAYTGPLHWNNRYFNYEEFKRLQTFPDNYNISGNKQIAVKQIGNSVPPQLARMMAIAIRQQIFRTSFPFELSLLEHDEELSFRKHKRELSAIYRKKAEMAIGALKTNKTILPGSHIYFAKIGDNFSFKEVNKERANVKISVEWSNQLTVIVDDIESDSFKCCAKIYINAKENNWTLPVEKVNLVINTSQRLAITAAWKAFEHELIINSIKADLVQLNGYYQYMPKLCINCWIDEMVQYHDVVANVMCYSEIPQIITTKELAERWRVKENDVFIISEYLKLLGYEIRNHSTNSQIESDHWLIPYAFPTLSPLSVQLRKHL